MVASDEHAEFLGVKTAGDFAGEAKEVTDGRERVPQEPSAELNRLHVGLLIAVSIGMCPLGARTVCSSVHALF